MHGFIIRGIELFLRTRHGDEVWAKVSSAAGIDRRGTMLMRIYPDEVATRLLDATSTELRISRDELLEDIGGWIPRLDSVRHIMRFSGSSFEDFVLSLDDLHDRGRVVLPGLELPRIATQVTAPRQYLLRIAADEADWYPVMAGFLRGMADEYGVLAIVETHEGCLQVSIADDAFAEGSSFSLIQKLWVS
ncbi:MAG TPA: heme NO-binding domain-containing protein [Paracoccus sp. (in: a-proteobacteria)]|uniref:heme NO-binding domain-containing protein n=1 Tax=uncultured Paracoccus sp. TaxID=189685 RepID=UPI00262E6EB7|nr:heme NO-binding domain-containing protein [uncultured Paracoccus sp.]HMQ40725.1 heme NO-binding domain-containing protein [Paracoccus sp. (in: a-proteobacteria)]HMR37623.1 heme NO-binding domain-containing protein [Paracoccus sp. (in: a-proteobacteria)]